jgi:uncharacterized protein (DUF4415 family)
MKRATTGSTTLTDHSDFARVKALADTDIVYDADNPRTTPDDWAGAVMKQGDVVVGVTPKRRGPGKKPAKIAIQLRVPPDLLARWKASGPGWQSRMVDWLQTYSPTA